MNRELQEAYGQWFNELAPWSHFVTLTFRDPTPNTRNWTRPGWAYAERAWKEFCAQASPLQTEFPWIRVTELQPWRGAPHFHALLDIADAEQLRLASSWFSAKYGFNRVLEYDPEKGAATYIAKYVAKDLSDIRFSTHLSSTN